jgi:peptidoglycan-N-acetylglucosamine deacetylase
LDEKFPINSLEKIPDKLVVLTFDDAVASHYTFVRPLLNQYGFSATFFITEGFNFKTDKVNYLTWNQIAVLDNDGFEIGNHTRDHRSVNELSLGELPVQLTSINDSCKSYGIPCPVSFAYPGNFIHEKALPILNKLGFNWARRGNIPELGGGEDGRGFFYDPYTDDPLLIPSSGIALPAWTLDDFKTAVAGAKNGKVAVLQFHGVPDIEHPWVNTSEDQFRSYMKYLYEKKYKVIALRDLGRFIDPRIYPKDPWAIIKARKKSLPTNN